MPSTAISCGANPTPLTPSKRIVPWVGSSSPVIWLKNVVLPAPLGPISETMPRHGMSKSMSLLACRPPYSFVRPRTSTRLPDSGCAAGAAASRLPAGMGRAGAPRFPGPPWRARPEEAERAEDDPADAPHASEKDRAEDGDGDEEVQPVRKDRADLDREE